MKIAVTGFPGQLASGIKVVSADFPAIECTFYSQNEWDLLDASRTVEVLRSKYDYVINCAAFTQVDAAESQVEIATGVNATAIKHMTEALNGTDTHLIQISTDYIYHPDSPCVLTEESPTNPKSVYAKTKFAGEEYLKNSETSFSIIRTSWVYSPVGHNFVKTMIRLLTERDSLSIVNDQWGCPTSAWELARAILSGIDKGTWKEQSSSIFNYTEKGWTSWFEMTKHINRRMKVDTQIIPIATVDYPTPATRPSYSIMDCSKFDDLDIMPRKRWENALDECLDILLDQRR